MKRAKSTPLIMLKPPPEVWQQQWKTQSAKSTHLRTNILFSEKSSLKWDFPFFQGQVCDHRFPRGWKPTSFQKIHRCFVMVGISQRHWGYRHFFWQFGSSKWLGFFGGMATGILLLVLRINGLCKKNIYKWLNGLVLRPVNGEINQLTVQTIVTKFANSHWHFRRDIRFEASRTDPAIFEGFGCVFLLGSFGSPVPTSFEIPWFLRQFFFQQTIHRGEGISSCVKPQPLSETMGVLLKMGADRGQN